MEISENLPHPSKDYAKCFLDKFENEVKSPTDVGKKLRWLGPDDPVHADLEINAPNRPELDTQYKSLKAEVNIWNDN